MRGFNRDGRTLFNNWVEQTGLARGAVAEFDIRPAFIGDSVPGDTSSTVTLTAGGSGRPDNYQPVEAAWYIPGPTALIDVYTPGPNTTGTLVVDDPNHVIAACDTPGDNDWFAVTLTAGQTYEFGQYAYVAAQARKATASRLPMPISKSTIAAGNLLVIARWRRRTPSTRHSGFDAL